VSIVHCTMTERVEMDRLSWQTISAGFGGRRATLTEQSTVRRAPLCQAARAMMLITVYSFTK
jgi:hypothetical protein